MSDTKCLLIKRNEEKRLVLPNQSQKMAKKRLIIHGIFASEPAKRYGLESKDGGAVEQVYWDTGTIGDQRNFTQTSFYFILGLKVRVGGHTMIVSGLV